MNQTRNNRILALIIILLFLFVGPLSLYRTTYYCKTEIDGHTKYSTEGWDMAMGLTMPFSRTKPSGDLNIKKSSIINLGIFTRIKLEADYQGMHEDEEIAFKMKSAFNFYGLGSARAKRDLAEATVLKNINQSRESIIAERLRKR